MNLCMITGPEGDRTHDLHNAIVALFQLSYRPVLEASPLTKTLVGDGPCSIKPTLSY